jgi:TrmH family RNA methyltransferase
VDLYNPKVVQATMGSIARVNVSYVDLNSFLSSTDLPVLAPLWKVNIYKTTLPQEGVVVMGNEANGISSLKL